METTTWDCIIIGGGAAGLSAALMLGRTRRRTLVIDGGEPRNRFAAHMHGVLGHDGLPPEQLLEKGRSELERYDISVRAGQVLAVSDGGHGLVVATDAGELATRTLLLATGITDTLPDLPGLAPRWGRTVLHCPYCHGWEVRDQTIGVLVTHPAQVHLAQMVRQWSDDVTVFLQEPTLLDDGPRARLTARGVRIVASPVTHVEGDAPAIDAVVTADGTRHRVAALFVGGIPTPQDSAVATLDLDRTEGPVGSFIAVRPDGATRHPRVWAAGNVVDPMANVPVAMSAGSTAGARINAALVEEDTDRAVAAPAGWDEVAPAAFWEERYASTRQSWSGRVNATLAAVVAELEPGRVLDLGCGEGADVVWLAEHGWTAHGIDISPTAIERGREAAATRGAAATFEARDLTEWVPTTRYDLVASSFFHSPVALPRSAVLRRASSAVKPGGHLLLVTHASAPPWADPEHVRHHTFLTARQEADALGLDPTDWEEVQVEEVTRTATGPGGITGELADGVVLLRRV